MLKLDPLDPLFDVKQSTHIDIHFYMGQIKAVLDEHGTNNEERAQQAADFIAADYLGDVPPLVQQVADISGSTPQEAADHIADMKAQCEALRAQMDDGFMDTLRILNCTVEQDIWDIVIAKQPIWRKRLKVNANYF